MTVFDEQILDHINITINYPPSRRQKLIQASVAIDNDDARHAIERFVGLRNIEDINLIASGIANRHTVGMDMQEMEYPHPKNPTTEAIIIGDGLEFSTHLTESAFNQLMLRIFDALIEKVNESDIDFASETAWQGFLQSVETLRDRVS